MDNRKELKNLYKSRTVTGGVYRITCQGNGRAWIKATKDLASQSSKFQFAIANNFCPEPAMHPEWTQFGAEAFSFQILEELEKKKTQSDGEFGEDIETLLEMWREIQGQGSGG